MSTKDLTIHLKIKTLRIPVDDRLPVIVIWSRQTKQAKTKKRLLSDQVDSTVFDEEFQISTSMACDEAGIPTKPKMVSIRLLGYRVVFIPDLIILLFSHNSQLLVIKHVASLANATLTWLSSAMTISRFIGLRLLSASMRVLGSK